MARWSCGMPPFTFVCCCLWLEFPARRFTPSMYWGANWELIAGGVCILFQCFSSVPSYGGEGCGTHTILLEE